MRTSFDAFGTVLANRSVTTQATPFTLKSGARSDKYADLRTGHSWGPLLARSGRYILEKVCDIDFDTVAGAGVDGRAVVTGVLMASDELPYRRNVSGLWINDQEDGLPITEDPKNGWGCDPVRLAGRRVLAVDGTLTSGGSLETLVGMIREAGATVDDAAVVLDRSDGKSQEVATQLGLTLHSLFLFDEQSGNFAGSPS